MGRPARKVGVCCHGLRLPKVAGKKFRPSAWLAAEGEADVQQHFQSISGKKNGDQAITPTQEKVHGEPSPRLTVEEVRQAVDQGRQRVEMPNRDFLPEFCAGHGLAIANTFCDVPVDKKVTHHEPWAPPLGPISAHSFTMLDLLLTSQNNLTAVQSIYSDRLATLASSYFPVTSLLRLDLLQSGQTKKQIIRRDWTVLQNPDLRRAISESISENMSDMSVVSDENRFWVKVCSAVASLCTRSQHEAKWALDQLCYTGIVAFAP